MNYNYVSQFLDNGLNPEEILAFLMKNTPRLHKKIKDLLVGGWGTSEILSYLNKDAKELSQVNLKKSKPVSPEEVAALQLYKSKREPSQSRDKQALGELQKFTSTALKYAPAAIGTAGLASYALRRAAPAAAAEAIIPSEIMSAQKALPFQQKSLPGPEILGISLQSEAPPVSPSPTAPTPEVAPIAPAIPQIDSFSFIKNLGPRVESFIKSAKDNPPENVVAALEKHFLNPEQKKEIRKNKVPFTEIVSDYIANLKSQPEEQEIPKAPISATEEAPIVKERKLALFPDDKVGQVESIDNGVAKVNFDGQVKNRKAEEIIESPLPEKDLADLYDELVAKIPEHARSSNIYWAGYDDNNNQFAFIPHGGALYIYENIPSEFADKLKNAMFKAKTSGESKHGMWVAGGESRGAGLYQLIKELQEKYGGKGKEYSAKYGSIYDYFALPREAAKKKEKERKKRERDAKRKK